MTRILKKKKLKIYTTFFSTYLFFYIGISLLSASGTQVTSGEVAIINDYSLGGDNLIGAGSATTFSSFLRMLIELALGGGAVLAVVLLVIGGVQYTTTDTFTGKQSGKETVTNALIGLGLIIASFFILIEINPALLNDQVSLTTVGEKSCGAIQNTSENALNEWMLKNPDWDIAGGPYYSFDKVNGGAVACKPDLGKKAEKGGGCLEQVWKIEKEQKDLEGIKTGYGNFYAQCLVCSGSGDNVKCTKKEEVDKNVQGQVFLLICESFRVHDDTNWTDYLVPAKGIAKQVANNFWEVNCKEDLNRGYVDQLEEERQKITEERLNNYNLLKEIEHEKEIKCKKDNKSTECLEIIEMLKSIKKEKDEINRNAISEF